MKNLSRLRWVTFCLAAVSSSAAALFIGCGSDDTAIILTVDATTEDVSSIPDGRVPPPTPDGSVPPEHDGDTGEPDVGVLPDADIEDVVDAQTFDVGPPSLESYLGQINRLYCLRIGSCCGDSTFDFEKCEQSIATLLVSDLQNIYQGYVEGGNVRLDEAKARQCFASINALGCGVAAAQITKGIYDNCLVGLSGTLAQGEFGCRSSGECAPPNHCDISSGAETGVCNPPRPEGASCSDGNRFRTGTGTISSRGRSFFFEPQAQCGTLITGQPGYCANVDSFVGTNQDGGPYECRPQESLDAGCRSRVECASGVCAIVDGRTTCAAGSPPIVNQATCDFYRLADAGDGG